MTSLAVGVQFPDKTQVVARVQGDVAPVVFGIALGVVGTLAFVAAVNSSAPRQLPPPPRRRRLR